MLLLHLVRYKKIVRYKKTVLVWESLRLRWNGNICNDGKTANSISLAQNSILESFIDFLRKVKGKLVMLLAIQCKIEGTGSLIFLVL